MGFLLNRGAEVRELLNSKSNLTGAPSFGSTDPTIVSLFHQWSHISTDLFGEMHGQKHHGFLVAGTGFVSHYRLLAQGYPLNRTFNKQISATEWSSVAMVEGTPKKLKDQKSPGDGTIPQGSIEVRTIRVLRGGWTESLYICNHSNFSRQTEIDIEIGCPISDKREIKQQGVDASREGIIPQLIKETSTSCSLIYQRNFGNRKNSPNEELKKELGIYAPHEGDPIIRTLNMEIKLIESTTSKDSTYGDYKGSSLQVSKGKITKIKAKMELQARQEICIQLQFSARIDRVHVSAPQINEVLPLPRLTSHSPSHDSQIITGNFSYNLILSQARQDLEDLLLPVFGGENQSPWSLMAGVPGYENYFGDDSLTGAWQSCIFSPHYLHEVIDRAALYQGVRLDPWRDEEVGRLAHQRNWSPTDVVGKKNKEIYYGDCETTPFWIITLATVFFWTGDIQFVKKNERVLKGCLDWILHKLNGEIGFLYYNPSSKDSTTNQGWKDSETAIVDSQGRIRTPPLATVELQGYCHLALILAATLYLELGKYGVALKLFERSQKLRKDFNQWFWMPTKSFYALALDGKGQQVDSITSNVGHCLGCGIIEANRLFPVVKTLLSPELFSGWGIRTLSEENPAYDPFSYHRGSVWAPDNMTIAAGMRLCGFDQEAATIIEAQLALATLYNQMRIPEAVGGQSRNNRSPVPGLYPNSNMLQVWSVSSIPFSVQVLLGLLPVAPLKTLFVRPFIPEWLSWVEIKSLRVGEAQLDLAFWRDSRGRSQWKIMKKIGSCKVIEQPMPFDPVATVGDRLAAFLKSVA